MIGVIGLNHKTALQDIRGLFFVSREEIVPLSELIQQNSGISEIVILSTCNRIEIYYYTDKSNNEKCNGQIINTLHQFKHLNQYFGDLFYCLSGIEAVKHLFAVTSGIDSAVIGEYQIVNQVKEAYMYCTEAALTDAVLMRLFQKCFETSKKVRSETELQLGATSISNVAVDVCKRQLGDLSQKSALLIGSGETGSLTLEYLKKYEVTHLFVTNRTEEKARALADKSGSAVVEFSQYRKLLPNYDIVMVATSATEFLIDRSDVEYSAARRKSAPQVFIDLSVPRNIDRNVESVENIYFYAIDQLQEIVKENAGKRMQCLDAANLIITEKAEEFMAWYETLTLRPLIKAITSNMQEFRENEMAAYKCTEEYQKFMLIDEYTNRITQKYIGMIIKNLKEISKQNPSSGNLKFINDLFQFNNNGVNE
jgi:glutamyl-tRNA reductase